MSKPGRYKAICKTCDMQSMESLSEGYCEFWAENHMMQTGHTVTIEEV